MVKFFDCRYGMYLHNKGLNSSIYGEDIIDAIKTRNQYAILLWVQDEDGTEYFVKEHDEPDDRGYYNYYWIDEDGNLLYDENKTKKEIPKPINIANTITKSGWISPTGKFYECEYEDHVYLATELIESGVVNTSSYGNPDSRLEKLKWIKLSSGEIRYSTVDVNVFTKKQKETILDYFKKNPINVWGARYSIKQLFEKY